MSQSKRFYSMVLILALLLSMLTGAALAEALPEELPEERVEELPEMDLMEFMQQDAPEEAEPAAQDTPGEAEPAAQDAPGEAEPAAQDMPEAEPAAQDMPGEAEPAAQDAPEEVDPAAQDMPAEADPDAQVMSTEADPAAQDMPVEAEPVAPTLALNATELTLGVGETFALQPVIPEGQEALGFEYATSNKKIATVNKSGVITAKKKGSATIAVRASDGTVLSCAVRVLKAPKSIKLNVKSLSLGFDAPTGVNTPYQLTVTLTKNTAAIVKYTSSNPAVAEVSATGLIIPKGHGTTTITASIFNKKKATCAVTVLPGPDAIGFEDPAPILCEKETRKLALTVPQGALAVPRFTSSNPEVAAVNAETGEITAQAYGQTVISAASFNGRTASCTVTVQPGPDSIALPAATITMGVGEKLDLGATPVRNDGQPTSPKLKYATSKSKYVAISGDGVLTAKKRGSAKITVTAPNGVKATCKVKAVKAPTSVKLSIGKDALVFDAARGIAEQTSLSVKLSSGSGSSVVFSGYDPAVVSVAPNGRVTAAGVGSTTITATTFNGLKASCSVTVLALGDIPSHDVVNVAHRGGAGYWAENTLEAFRNAPSAGATAIELDVCTTKDGVQVVHHDPGFTIGEKNYTIKKLTFARLRKLRPDVCTLDEALEVISAGGLELNLELKDTATPKACVESVRRHNMQSRTMYISFSTALLSKVRKLEPSARLGLCFTNAPANLSGLVSGLGVTHVFQRDTKLTLTNLQAWQQRGLKVGVWTVDDAAGIHNWLGMGVDYITSNYPRLVTEAIAAR